MDIFSLAGKTALVTGSSRGIGNAIAMVLGKAGAKVIYHGTADSPAMRDALKRAKSAGFTHDVIYGDIGKEADCSKISAQAVGVDILVLNASVQDYFTLETFNSAEFERTFNANVRSAFLFIKAIVPNMAKRGWGRVISIGSVNQSRPSLKLSIYASSKAALQNIMIAAAKQYAEFGVTVNTVTPGVIDTDRNRKVLSDKETAKRIANSIPAHRLGSAEDCAGIVLALASNACSYITGADIPVDGGMLL